MIEQIKAKDDDDYYQSEDELTNGRQTRAKLGRRVFKKINELSQHINNTVTPEIHERYAVEITDLKKSHYNEIERLSRKHQIELEAKLQF